MANPPTWPHGNLTQTANCLRSLGQIRHAQQGHLPWRRDIQTAAIWRPGGKSDSFEAEPQRNLGPMTWWLENVHGFSLENLQLHEGRTFFVLSILIGIIGKCASSKHQHESMKWEIQKLREKSLTPCLTPSCWPPRSTGCPDILSPASVDAQRCQETKALNHRTIHEATKNSTGFLHLMTLPSYHPTMYLHHFHWLIITIYHYHYNDKTQKNTQWSNILRASSHIRQHPQQLLREHVVVPVATSRHSTLAQHEKVKNPLKLWVFLKPSQLRQLGHPYSCANSATWLPCFQA